jgi:copper transport protein
MTTLLDTGVVFWFGAQLWRSFVLRSGPETDLPGQCETDTRAELRFEHWFALPLLLISLLANLGVLVGQALLLTAGNIGQALSPTLLISLASNGHYGMYWTMRLLVLFLAFLLAIFMFVQRDRSRMMAEAFSWTNLILGLALLIVVALSGHAAAISGNLGVVAVLGDWLHLLAASLWIGGMLYLALVYLPVLSGSNLVHTQILLTTLARFSPLAIAGVIIMSITGPFNATVHMESFNQFLTTAYGRALLVKVVLVIAMLLTSAFHVGVLRPRLEKAVKEYVAAEKDMLATTTSETNSVTKPGVQEIKSLEKSIAQQQQRLTTALRWEPLLGVGVLVCTGLLAVFAGTLQPAADTQQSVVTAPSLQQQVAVKPFNAIVKTTDNKFTIKVTVSPNRFGTNVFTASVFDSNGAPDTNVGVTIYTQMLDMDMGTDAVNLQPDNKGHFSAQGDLNMGGHWHLRIQVRTPQNTLHEGGVDLYTPF